MNLEDALEKLATWAPKRLTFPPTPKMVQESHALTRRLPDLGGTPVFVDVAELQKRLAEASANGTLDDLAPRDWRYVPECLSMGSPPLIENERFLDEYLQRLKKLRSTRDISMLIRFYLMHFNPTHKGIIKIAAYLKEAVKQWRWHWAEREALGLFDVPNAHVRLAKYAMQAKDAVTDAMEAAGFSGSLYGARLAGHAYIAAAQELRNTPSSLPVIRRFAAWGKSDDRFAFDSTPGADARMAEAMLLPWVDRQPPDEVRTFIEGHLLSLLHDLRIERSRWVDVDEEAKRVMRRWLTRASLEQFLDVVDRTAQSHMWPARRKFWGAYYEHEYMREAWVAFAREGADLAKSLAAEKENPAIGNFGVLAASANVQRNHAVLIMQISELTVADWSHSGKCHIWLSENPSSPKLYRSYSRDELINDSDFEKKHGGQWQLEVHDFIRRHTGIRMNSREYM